MPTLMRPFAGVGAPAMAGGPGPGFKSENTGSTGAATAPTASSLSLMGAAPAGGRPQPRGAMQLLTIGVQADSEAPAG